jgi:hypothetical protein
MGFGRLGNLLNTTSGFKSMAKVSNQIAPFHQPETP